MKSDKANTMDCPFVSRKCKGDKCMAWGKDLSLDTDCMLISDKRIYTADAIRKTFTTSSGNSEIK